MYSVYVLECADHGYYVGCAENLAERIDKHAAGKVVSTRDRLPVRLIVSIDFHDKYKAYAFEKYLKSGSGRAFMSRHLI